MVSQKETVRGKERIQQLMEQFPEAKWREVILTELHTEGIRPNETSRQLGRWALPDAPSYFERNREAIFKTAERSEMGYYYNPFICYFGDGTSVWYLLDTRSPYEVRYEERGRYRLYRDGEPLEEAFFTPRPQWFDRKTSSGRPMASIISTQTGEDSLKLAAMTYCEYGKDDLACRYCNINSSESVSKEVGLVRQTAKREQDVYETMLAACQESKKSSLFISGGVILEGSKEADMYARLVKAASQAVKDAGYEAPLPITVKPRAVEPEDAMKLKEAGATGLGYNLEVWDPKLFEFFCPGKAKYVGRERWLERLVGAVEVMGKGNVQSSTMVGLELAPPHGFKTEDEGAESYLEGTKWLLDHGIKAGGAVWRPAPNTMFEGLPSPRTEYALRVRLAAAKLALK